MPDLPAPVSRDQEYLSALCGLIADQNRLLNEQNVLLASMRDQTAPPAVIEPPREGAVDLQLKEPAAPSAQPKTSTRAPRRAAKKGNTQ